MFVLGLNRTFAKMSAWLSITLLSLPLTAFADDKEHALKAALIYKMGKYVTWTNPPKNLNYCFVGENSKHIGEILASKLNQINANDTVIEFKSALADIERYECHVIYVAKAVEADSEKLTDLSKFSLTIGSEMVALQYGFISVLELQSRKPQLYASKRNLKNAKFKLSSRLLKSSKLVD